MLDYWRRKLKTAWFDHQTREIWDTPPLRMRPAPWTIVSLVRASHVGMYVLALKSVYARLDGGRVVAIVHGALAPRVRARLEIHAPGIEILDRDKLETGACQPGGTWERLVHVVDRSSESYVIQMDADVLAFGIDLREVRDCASANVSFTLSDGAPLMSMPAAAAAAQETEGDYIGDVAERLFDRYPGGHALRYVRGSSAFAGLAKGGFTRAALEDFHGRLEAMLGPAWRRWGTEQVGSNFAVANSPDAVVLPFPEYANFKPNAPWQAAKLLHFLGTYRFDHGVYAAKGRAVISQLGQAIYGLD